MTDRGTSCRSFLAFFASCLLCSGFVAALLVGSLSHPGSRSPSLSGGFAFVSGGSHDEPGSHSDDLRRAAGRGLAPAGHSPVAARGAVAPWLKLTAAVTQSAPCDSGSSASSSPSSSPSASPTSSGSCYSAESCDSSLGLYPFPTSGPSASALPSWALPSDGPECAQLVHTEPAPSTATVTVTPDPDPGLATTSDVVASVEGLRTTLLFVGGLLVCLLAALLIKGRWS